jgi:hypothetical protein
VWSVCVVFLEVSLHAAVGDAKRVHVRPLALFDPSNFVHSHFGDQCGIAGADGGAVAQDSYALLVVPVVQNQFSKYRSRRGPSRRSPPRPAVNRSDSPSFVASRRVPSTVPEKRYLAVRRRGVGLHQSQDGIAVGTAHIDYSPAIT